MPTSQPLALASPVRAELEAIARSPRTPASLVQRARLIVALADGATYADLTARWGLAATSISRWKQRFAARGIAGLTDAPRSGRPARVAPAVEARILALTRQAPPPPLIHWSVRRIAGCVGVSPATVHRVWARLGLQPPRLERSAGLDLEVERTVVGSLGLYLWPPVHAAVFSVREYRAGQSSIGLGPASPAFPALGREQGSEHSLDGPLSLYAALEGGTGQVERRTGARCTNAALMGFLDRVITTQPRQCQILVLCDNRAAQNAGALRDWLAADPRVTILCTPTYSSWLNRVELQFATLERDGIARGIVPSVPDLRRRLMQYIRLHHKTSRPFQWIHRSAVPAVSSGGH